MTHWIAADGSLAIIDLPEIWWKQIGTNNEDGWELEEFQVVGDYLESIDPQKWEGVNLDSCEWGSLIDASIYVNEKEKKKENIKIIEDASIYVDSKKKKGENIKIKEINKPKKKKKLRIMTEEEQQRKWGVEKAKWCMEEAKRIEKDKTKRLMDGLIQDRHPMDVTREVLGDEVADKVNALLDKIDVIGDPLREFMESAEELKKD